MLKHKVANRRFLLSDLQPPHCQREPLSHALMAAAKAMRFGSSRRPSTGDASTTATRIRKSPVSLIMSNSSCRNYLKKHPYIPAFIHLQYHRANFYKISDLGLRPRAEIPMLIPWNPGLAVRWREMLCLATETPSCFPIWLCTNRNTWEILSDPFCANLNIHHDWHNNWAFLAHCLFL